MNAINIGVLGPPGSGKGTQARRLSEEFSLAHIDVGMCLRYIAEEQTPLGKEVFRIINEKRELVPDTIFIRVLEQALQNLSDNKSGCVLDGAPRSISQVFAVETAFLRSGRRFDAVIFLDVSENLLVERIARRFFCKQCQYFFIGPNGGEGALCPKCSSPAMKRKDDTAEGLHKRLLVFRTETLPVVEHYRAAGKLISIDGSGSVDEVGKTLKRAVEKRFSK